MLINGYAYFPYFPMIFTVIAQWLMITFDFKSQAAKRLEFTYIYGYVGLFFAITMGFNVQIIFGNFIVHFVTPWIFWNLNSKVKFHCKCYKQREVYWMAFSIIVPIYNVEEYLPQCIESVSAAVHGL